MKNRYLLSLIALLALNMGLTTNMVVAGSQEDQGIIGKTLAVIATSSAMHRYNQFFAKNNPLQGVPASEALQALGKEAQTTVGIPADRQVPIQHVAELDAAAMATNNAIVTGNEFTNDEVPYGVKRCNMFHEAVHVKYHDQSFGSILKFGSLLAIPLATQLLIKPQGKLKLLYIPALATGYYASGVIKNRFHHYRERRADIEGHYATQCHQCVTEKANDISTTYKVAQEMIDRLDNQPNLDEAQIYGLKYGKDWIESKKSYLSIEENETIAAELKRDNKVCAFHEQSQ